MKKIFGEDTSKKQLNLRLKEPSIEKLSEIFSYWKDKGKFKFLNVYNVDQNIFNSEVSFSKFILETALNNLYIDLENEKQIDLLAQWVSDIRTTNEKIKSSWNNLSESKFETWFINQKKELQSYIENLDKYAKEDLLKKAEIEFPEVNEEFFDIIWPIAINRSHHILDKKKESSQNDLKISRLKKHYL